MREFLASILTVIAMGVLLIAYTLSGSRVAAAPAGVVQYDPQADGYQLARPAFAERVALTGDPYAPYAVRTPVTSPMNTARPVAADDSYVPTAPATPGFTASDQDFAGHSCAIRAATNSKPRPANKHKNGYAVIQCLVPPKMGVVFDHQGA